MANPPSGGVESINLGDTSNAAGDCRRKCKQQAKTLAFLDPTSKQCICHTPDNLQNYLTSAQDEANCWTIYMTSAAESYNYSIGFVYTEHLPSDKMYIRPNETIVYDLKVETLVEVIFIIDFGDGSVLKTSDRKVSHFWRLEGTYNVNITAKSRASSETKVFEVKIQWVDEGTKPDMVTLDSSYTSDQQQIDIYSYFISPATMDCILYYGDGQTESLENLDDMIHRKSVQHTYETVGFYDVSMTCNNAFGSTVSKEVIPVRNTTMDFKTRVIGRNVVIPFYGSNAHKELLHVRLDHVSVEPLLSESSITIPKEEFKHSGEHLIEIKTDEEILRRRVVNLQEEIRQINITALPAHTIKEGKVLLTFQIESGDHVHVVIDYGDGKIEHLYFPRRPLSGPIIIYRSHAYQEHGKFEVKMTAANDVSFKKISKLISVERPIILAEVAVNDVKFLGEAAEFVFNVDPDLSPALPFLVELDLGNGNTAKDVIGENRAENTPAKFRYEYPQYGTYDVYIKVSNNLSEYHLRTSLQVGENITQVDMRTSKQVVKDGEEMEIYIDCPRGQPVLYDISLGDGQIIKISVPNDYVPEHDMVVNSPVTTTPHTYYSTEAMSVFVTANSSNIDVSRKKREAGDGGSESTTSGSQYANVETSTWSTTTSGTPITTTAPEMQLNDVIVAKYTYKSPGEYTVKVKVSNIFGYRKTWSCPPIRVVPSLSIVSCEKMDATLSVQSSEQAPMSALRSEEVSVAVSMDASCADLDEDPIFDYTWYSERKMSGSPDKWRPELGVCHSGHKEPTLVIPPLTLWYGLYHIKVTVRMRVDPNNIRVRRAIGDSVTLAIEPSTDAVFDHSILEDRRKMIEEELRQILSKPDNVPEPEDFSPLDFNGRELTQETASADLYVQIQPSPLVAKYKDGSHLDIPMYDMITLNFEDSHDPDVAINKNRTGMTAHVFCYPDRLQSDWLSKTLDEKLGISVHIASNTFGTAAIYDNECFMTYDRVWMLGWEAVFPADNLYKNDSMNFELVVLKDTRVATTSRSVRVI